MICCRVMYMNQSCGGVSTNTGASVSDSVGVIMIMDKGMSMGSVLKNGFGILNFAEAPNQFDPLGVAYRGRGAGGQWRPVLEQ